MSVLGLLSLLAQLACIWQAWRLWMRHPYRGLGMLLLFVGLVLMAVRRLTALGIEAAAIPGLGALDRGVVPCVISLCLAVGFWIGNREYDESADRLDVLRQKYTSTLKRIAVPESPENEPHEQR